MAVTIRGKQLPLPIIQGGMGIGVSLDGLAGAVARRGGMGTISAALPGVFDADFWSDPKGVSLRALDRQVRRAREMAQGAGLVAVNVMVASKHYADSVRTALAAGADAIVCGAGLPTDLPALAAQVPESDASLAPIISSGRAAGLICRLWERKSGRLPDFMVLEGVRAGGHLGFTPEEARGTARPLGELLKDVLASLAPFKEKLGRDIPVFVAGGIRDGAEMAEYMGQGAAGAQFATRFITTEECDAHRGFKEALVRARPEDITIVQSPVGMPGRALRSPLIERVEAGTQQRPRRCIGCLTPCDPGKTPYCISRALIDAARGDWENGLFFCGANAGEKNTITTVDHEIDTIMNEWRNAQ